MKLIELSSRQLREIYHTRMKEDFPPAELKPLATMRALQKQGRYQALGLFDGSALVGYALMWREPEQPFVLLDYLGTDPLRRGQGLGRIFLDLLAEHYCQLRGILAEAEAPESGEIAGAELRQRRLGFYFRNGFVYGGYDCALFGVHYKALIRSREPVSRDELLAAHQAIYHSHLPGILFRRFVRLPLKPGDDIPPSLPVRGNLPHSNP